LADRLDGGFDPALPDLPAHHKDTNVLYKNFRPYSYAKLVAEYPCIIVRTHWELDATSSKELFDLNPELCSVNDIQICAVGIACKKILKVVKKG
jgi:hypothetical protein